MRAAGMCHVITIHVAVALLAACITAAPSNPIPQRYRQPNTNSTFLLNLHGGPNYRWMSDQEGYTVLRNTQGWYNYATKTTIGNLVSSGIPVGSRQPTRNLTSLGLVPHVTHEEQYRRDYGIVHNHLQPEGQHHQRNLLPVPQSAICNYNGTKNQPCRLRALVFLVRFADHHDRILPTRQDYEILFNYRGPREPIIPSGSVADVFLENSYGTFVLESYVTPWLNVSQTEGYATGGTGRNGLNRPETKETWNEAMTMFQKSGEVNLDDFDKDGDHVFDCIVILHSGAPAEYGGRDCETNKDPLDRIWSHATASNLYETPVSKIRTHRFYVASGIYHNCPPGNIPGTKWAIVRIGVIAHEAAHFLGLPDLYDTDAIGQGNYELQANMWGWDNSQYYPPMMGAWSRMKLGWVEPIHVFGEGVHSYELEPACKANTILYIDHRLKEGEYFLIEYRWPCGFDIGLKAQRKEWDRSGGALWHIDETKLNDDITFKSNGLPHGKTNFTIHYAVALVQSDGAFHLERTKQQGGNRGDKDDLFLTCRTWECDKNNQITNDGIYNQDGSFNATQPNTMGYASDGTELSYETGISIIFGEYNDKLKVTVTLEGVDPEPNEWPGPDKFADVIGIGPPSADPTPSPTPLPTFLVANVHSTPAPAYEPATSPVRRLTPFPTVDLNVPISPVQRTPFPTVDLGRPPIVSGFPKVEMAHKSAPEDMATWEAKFSSHGLVTNTLAYNNFYNITNDESMYNGLLNLNQQVVLLAIPIDCQSRDRKFEVVYRGVGDRPEKMKSKHCGWFLGNNTKYCPLLDIDPNRSIRGTLHARIWQVCQNECNIFTHCNEKAKQQANLSSGS